MDKPNLVNENNGEGSMQPSSSNDVKSIFPFIALTSLFFLWGFITVLVDSLIPRIRELFTLNYFQAGLVQFAFFMAYFILSIPAGFILSKIGYKKGIILGLLTMALGCFLFYPAAQLRLFGVFLMAYFVLAGGMTILQVAANPYVAVLGDKNKASSRLNLAQAFNSMGTAIAPIIGAMFLLSDTVKSKEAIELLSEADRDNYLVQEAMAVQDPFLFITVVIIGLALVFSFVKLPALIQSYQQNGYGEAMKNKTLMMGALGIFVYVGAEVAIGSYLVNYFMDMQLAATVASNEGMMQIADTIAQLFNQSFSGKDPKSLLAVFVTFYWTGAMIGRFVGAVLTQKFNPAYVLAAFATGAIILVFLSMNTVGLVSMWAILSVGLFNSIMFPTIFTLSISNVGTLKPQASGILCTMIVGGAIVPPLYGYFTDMLGFKTAFVVVLCCYAYIVFFGFKTAKEAASS
jgi:FHS family L-fucose permease-like MFS transporter